MTQPIQLIRKNLLQVIEKQDISISSLERKAGITPGILSNFLGNRTSTTSFITILSAATVLGCSIDELLGVKSDTPKPDNIHVSWNPEFFLEVTNYICNKFQRSSISTTKIIELISEIYTYSINRSGANPSVNEQFAEWLIDKYNSKKF
jgi:transcriptional regulator with XRE-family HTH domain